MLEGRRVSLGEMDDETLEELRSRITEYFETFYAELRRRLHDHELDLPHPLPEHLRGYRRVVSVLGKDGIVITHWPAPRDSFDFHISPDKTAAELVAEECAGERILEYPPGSDFGTCELDEPLRLTVGDQVVWTSPWTRLEVSSRLDAWSNPDRARKTAEAVIASIKH